MNVLKDSISKTYLHYLLPTLLASVSGSLYCLADVYFIAEGSGSLGLAALNIVMPIFAIYSAIGLWIGSGCASLLSIAYGQKNETLRNQAFSLGMNLLVIIGISFCILGLIFRKPLLYLFGSDASLYPYAEIYFIPVHCAAFSFILGYALPLFLRNDFAPKKAMLFTMSANFLNIILDYVFVMIFQMGLQGAAIATAISSFVGVCFMLSHFFQPQCTLKYVGFTFDLSLMKRMLSAGFGATILEGSTSLINVVFNHAIMNYGGALGLAAYSIVTNIAYVTKGLLNGFAQSSQPLISSNFGARQFKRVKKSVILSCVVTLCFALLLYLSFLWKAEFWSSLFASNDALLIEKASFGIRIYFISLLPNAFTCMMLTFLQGCEYGKSAAIIALCKGCIFTMVLIYPFSLLWQISGIYAVVPCSEILGVLLSIYGVRRLWNECIS